MRVAFTSDLHVDLDPRNEALLDHMARAAAAAAPDVFIVAGDLAESAGVVGASLERFAALGARKLYLAGNHDLFAEGEPGMPGFVSSRDKYEDLLPRAAAAAGFEYLGLEAVHAGDCAFVGVPGWYDYTLRDPALDVAVHPGHYRAGLWRGFRAYDRGHVLWPSARPAAAAGAHPASVPGGWAGDEEICDLMLERLEAQLVQAAERRHIVAVVHVLPSVDAVERGLFGATAFHDAYLGSARLGARLAAEPRLRAILFGHLHRVADSVERGVRVAARPVGQAAKSPLSLADLARERLGVLDIEA